MICRRNAVRVLSLLFVLCLSLGLLAGGIKPLAEEEVLPLAVVTPENNTLGYHDFGTSYGVEVRVAGEKLYDADAPSIADKYADFIEINGIAGKDALLGYGGASAPYGVNYTHLSNTLVMFFTPEAFNRSSPKQVVLKAGFSLLGETVLEETLCFELIEGTWSRKTSNRAVSIKGSDGTNGITTSDGVAKVLIFFEQSLNFSDGSQLAELAAQRLVVNSVPLAEIEGASLVWKSSIGGAELALPEESLNRYRSNEIFVKSDFPTSSGSSVEKSSYFVYSNLSAQWASYECADVRVEASDNVGSSGQSIVEHASGLYEINLYFSEPIRPAKGFETFVQADYLDSLYVNGESGAEIVQRTGRDNAIQIHYDSDALRMTVYFLKGAVDFAPGLDHELLLNATFPVGENRVLGQSLLFSYSGNSDSWSMSETSVRLPFDFRISTLDSENGIVSVENAKVVSLAFSAPLSVSDGILPAEELDYIRVNGYLLSELQEEGCKISYVSSKNLLQIFIPNNSAGAFSEDSRNVILLAPGFAGLELSSKVKFEYAGGVWNKITVSDLDGLELAVSAYAEGNTPVTSLGYFAGIRIRFSAPIRDGAPTVAQFVSFVQKDYAQFMSLNGVRLNETDTEMHYDVVTDTLIVYFARNAIPTQERYELSFDPNFPVSMTANGVVSRTLGESKAFVSESGRQNWREKYVYDREFSHDFAAQGADNWRTEKNSSFENSSEGLLLNGTLYRRERAGNFNYSVSVKLNGGRAKLIFRTSESGYGGYELILSENRVVLNRRRPFELVSALPQKLSETEYSLSQDEFISVRVRTRDYNIYVYLNDSKLPVISVFDYAMSPACTDPKGRAASFPLRLRP